MWGVGRLQVHGICARRQVYREVVEARSNYITAWGDPTGSNRIEKDRVRVPPGLVRRKKEKKQCGLVCVERL